MRSIYGFIFVLVTASLFAQTDVLPHYLTESEKAELAWGNFINPGSFELSIPEPPPAPVRHMAEWEELEALVITWAGYQSILREIVRHAKEEVTVLIVVEDDGQKTQVGNYLQNNDITLDNVEFVLADYNSIWVRDYGQNTVYANEVEDRYFIDWVYNRPRPKDDVIPDAIGDHLNTPVYTTTAGDWRMVNTGGNFMSDGLGTAFASQLILEENAPGNAYNAGPHDEEAIDGIFQEFMGIDEYVKFETLPFDVIHHIDMHMHLVDEETILWSEYPEGVADGPQIEANIAYLQANYETPFGNPYRIERIIAPADAQGQYPDHPFGDYWTYTNSVFVNKTILVPFYAEQYDTVAQRIYEEHFPGYNVVGIPCNSIIQALGALHCITKEVGVSDPLWIVHERQRDITDNDTWGDYPLSAQVKHRDGVTEATLFWRTDMSQDYQPIVMTADVDQADTWQAAIPHQADGTTVYYYIHAEAENGKQQVRPLAAPEGYYHFTVNDATVSSLSEVIPTELQPIYPNPASALTVIPVTVAHNTRADISVVDVTGRLVETVFSGTLSSGTHNHFIQAAAYTPGTYFVRFTTEAAVITQKLIVK